MAKKKKRPRPRPPAATRGPVRDGAAPDGGARGAGAARGGANIERRERKEEARKVREAERRRARRAASLRRTLTAFGIAAAAVAAVTLYRSFQGPNDIPRSAIRAAETAGCTTVEQPAVSAPAQQHLAPGQPYTYKNRPATSGYHDPSPLPPTPKVYDTQPPETRAVHSLEHGAIFVYYLPEADGGLPQDVVDRLATIARGDRATFLAPYPDLTPDKALTLTAWNRRQSCPVTARQGGTELSPSNAATIVNGFVTAFECTWNAPENGASPC
jgi:Protein of unknown function (DUF3105)